MVFSNIHFYKLKNENEQLKDELGINNINWDCPILLEQGIYKFYNGILISPSGKELVCNKTQLKDDEVKE
jgi:hypothetical protein